MTQREKAELIRDQGGVCDGVYCNGCPVSVECNDAIQDGKAQDDATFAKLAQSFLDKEQA